jgi:hypothetical protein
MSDLYNLAMSVLPNVKGLRWYVYRMPIEGEAFVGNRAYEKDTIRMIEELALRTDNAVVIQTVGYDMSVAEVKGRFFAIEGVHKWIMSADDDFIFPYSSLESIVNTLNLCNDPSNKVFLYSTIDVYNERDHSDYIGREVSFNEAKKLAEEFGQGILPHLRIRNLIGTTYAHYFMNSAAVGFFPTLMPVTVGSGGWIVHKDHVKNKSITSLLNFAKGVRGYDIQFCSYYDKYLICETEVWHTGIQEPFYNKYWESFSPEAEKIYNST